MQLTSVIQPFNSSSNILKTSPKFFCAIQTRQFCPCTIDKFDLFFNNLNLFVYANSLSHKFILIIYNPNFVPTKIILAIPLYITSYKRSIYHRLATCLSIIIILKLYMVQIFCAKITNPIFKSQIVLFLSQIHNT